MLTANPSPPFHILGTLTTIEGFAGVWGGNSNLSAPCLNPSFLTDSRLVN